jgi:hypothetical protein
MAQKEKGRQNGDPIPNVVLADSSEFNAEPSLTIQRGAMHHPQTNRAALAGRPVRKEIFNSDENNKAAETDQAETEIHASSLLKVRASRLVRLYAVNAAMAETLAPLVFLEALR